jgi:hypothetical protein
VAEEFIRSLNAYNRAEQLISVIEHDDASDSDEFTVTATMSVSSPVATTGAGVFPSADTSGISNISADTSG